jgi:hypothetical protein
MNLRERIHTALSGELPDQVPWSIYRGLLPRDEEAERLQALGLAIVLNASTITVERPNVKITTEPVDGCEGLSMRTYQTPVGCLQQIYRIEGGYGSSWTMEYPVKGPDDYAVLEFIINDTVYRPNYGAFQETDRTVGETGFVMTSLERTPIQKLWIEFTGIERLSIDLHENRDTVESVLNAFLTKQREMWAIIADSPAEYVWCPDNITGAVVGPPLFERYIVPYYQALASFMHAKGKRLIAHMDGMMRSLVDCVAKLELDVIEAFTPPPDGDLPLAEARAAWKDKVIWINFPSSLHLAEPERIREMTRELLKGVTPGDRILFGVTENIPHHSWRQSLRAITEAMNEYGRCPISKEICN